MQCDIRSVSSFLRNDLCLQLNIKANEVSNNAKHAFGRYVYFVKQSGFVEWTLHTANLIQNRIYNLRKCHTEPFLVFTSLYANFHNYTTHQIAKNSPFVTLFFIS
jgi:hypothetical protein